MRLKRSAFHLSLFTVLAFPSASFAQDIPPVIAELLKSWEAQLNVKPTYKTLSVDGDDATLEGVEAAIPAGDGMNVTLTVEKMVFSDIGEETNGIIEIGSTAWSNMKFVVPGPDGTGFEASIPESAAEGIYVKVLSDNPTAADKFRAGMSVAKKSTSGPITFVAAGQTVTSDGYEMTWDGDPVTGAGKTTGMIKNVVIPETALAMADPSGTLKNLGYSSISFDIGGSGDVTNDGTAFGMDFDGFYDVKDVAKLNMGVNAANVPHELMEELKRQPQPDEAKVLSMSQNVSFARFVIRLEDKSITKKLLPMLAAMQGMDEATMVANAGAMVQLGMSQLQMPELATQVATAVNAYLSDPKSLTISLKPPAPVTVGQLMTINPADISGAVKMLGVTVTAND